MRLDGPRQITALVHELERLPESLGTGLEAALADYARAGTQSDVAMLISDAHVPSAELQPALRTLASCARTAGLIHMVAGDEPETTLRGPVELRDAESGRVIETTLDDQTAVEYAERFAEFGAGRARAVPRARAALPASAQRRGRARPPARARGRRGSHARLNCERTSMRAATEARKSTSASTSSGTRHARRSPVSAPGLPGASSEPPVWTASCPSVDRPSPVGRYSVA